MRILKTYIFATYVLVFCSMGWGAVEIYDYPDEAPRASDFEVTANGHAVFVYDTQVAAVATFGLSGVAEVSIKPSKPFEQVVIRPLSKGIKAAIRSGTISFKLDAPIHLCLELDGNIKRPLFIFVDSPEKRPADLRNPKLKYFAPGRMHRADEIRLASGQTLYIAGGAIVQGYVRADDAENIKVLGPGILDATYRKKHKTTMMKLTECSQVEIRDVLMIDSFGWTVHLSRSSDVLVDNNKQVGWRANSDGIDIEACHRVRVNHCFLRNADDCVAVKSKSKGEGFKTTENILVTDTVFWNSLPGNAMEIGFELRAEAIRNVVFRDCDIIRVERGAAFSIHNGDNALVEDVLFENIRVEDVRGDFADMYIGLSIYSVDCPNPFRRSDPKRKPIPRKLRDPESGDNAGQWIVPTDKSTYTANRGSIRNVTFRNIQFLGDELPPSLFIGYDEDHAVEDITFDGIYLNGHQLSDWPKGKLLLRQATNVRFIKP